MKKYASWIRFSSVFKFSALSDLFFLKNYRFRLGQQNKNYKKDRNLFSSFTKFKCIY